jgi:hypothetical protein
MIPVTCRRARLDGIAYIGVVDHPYHAVTGEDGAYRIENLPPGTYVIEAWHERTAQTQTVTVAVGQTGGGLQLRASTARTRAAGRAPFDPHQHHAPRPRRAEGRFE